MGWRGRLGICSRRAGGAQLRQMKSYQCDQRIEPVPRIEVDGSTQEGMRGNRDVATLSDVSCILQIEELVQS